MSVNFTGLQNILTNSGYSKSELELIKDAFQVAQVAHEPQKRLSGEPYITHPLAIAEYLARMGMDTPTIAAALLHDTVEDTPVTIEQIRKQFGTEIAFLVDGVTKLETVRYQSTPGNKKSPATDAHVESLKKMFLAMAQDIRVILLKLADRLHNMETLKYKSATSRQRIALETMEIYAPIAARLGIGSLKGQLEDLAFPYAYPVQYKELSKWIKDKYADRLAYIERVRPLVKRRVQDAGIEIVNIHSRTKHQWSLYKKLQRYELDDPEKIYDLVALRIIVPDIKACYEALGVVHTNWRPLSGRIKDYIAVPKPNGYRSLHTTIFCEKGRQVEVQIRTPEMHDHAENGIAAHWAYSESGKRKPVIAKAQEVSWVNQLKNLLKEIKTKEGLKHIQIDFFKNRIFVFTPRGDIKDLPEGATPIDLAYAIHSAIGDAAAGAKVNNKLVPFDRELKMGDVVEIVKSKTAHPSMDWLHFVKTAEAKKRIRNWIKENEPTTAVIEELPTIKVVARKHRVSTQKPTGTKLIGRIVIDNQADLMYKLGKCCAPIAGQQVCGYITRAKGVTVHLADCKNIKSADSRRLLDARWS